MNNAIPFQKHDDFEYGKIQEVSPLIRRIVARNPSIFTFRGTGTYIIGRGDVAVIDPGPNLKDHISAIAESLAGETISHIVITHTHSDHSSAALPLQAICGAPIYGCRLQTNSDTEWVDNIEEDLDQSFHPTYGVKDGDMISGNGWSLQCVHTPGHMSNHFCYRFLEEQALFSGDHVMGWSTSVIIPPDGSMSSYILSLNKLLGKNDQVYYPTHGPAIRSPKLLVEAYIEHRRQREAKIVQCLQDGVTTVDRMVPIVYQDTEPALHAAAGRSLLATIIKLWEEKKVMCDGQPSLAGQYHYIGT